MNVGFRALPVDPETKAPFTWLTPHGVTDATDDPSILQQWMALAGDAGLGIAPGDAFAILDDDRGDLDPGAFGIAGTYSETTRRGFHRWVRVPDGRSARKRKIDGGDLLTGLRCYAVSSPTPPYWPIDLEAPILSLPRDSILLTTARTLATSVLPITEPTMEHIRRAGRVVQALLHAPDPKMRCDIERLLSGDITGKPSASEADYDLASLASFHTTDPHVILAVLQGSDLRRPKWTSNKAYLSRTVHAALAQRAVRRDGSRASTVSDGTFQHAEGRKGAILGFLADSEGDSYCLLEVGKVATHCGVDRRTISRDLRSLEDAGLIETRVIHERLGERIIKSRLARLARGEAAS